jgi:hypothetical protein
MTAASVLSLCMSLIARSPPDSSRSPHKLSPPPTPPPPSRRPPTSQRLPRPRARSLSSSRSSPVRHRRPRRTPPRVCTYAQAGEHPRTQKCRCWYVAIPALLTRRSLPAETRNLARAESRTLGQSKAGPRNEIHSRPAHRQSRVVSPISRRMPTAARSGAQAPPYPRVAGLPTDRRRGARQTESGSPLRAKWRMGRV